MCRRSSNSGFGVLLLFFLLTAFSMSGLLLDDTASYFETVRKEHIRESREKTREARDALALYMLLRADRRFALARGSTGSVTPRILMLPCPDNIGDGNLDGSQDVSCSGVGSASDVVNGVLDGGSRFGRLPWRTKNLLNSSGGINHSLNDGIDIDVHDAFGNRLWYALAHNLAPSPDASPITLDARMPMNLHRLMTREEGWLTVVGAYGQPVAEKVAAVILAPGKAQHPRPQEQMLITVTVLNHTTDVAAAGGMLSPQRYFEAYTVSTFGTVTLTYAVANYNTDGTFIHVPPPVNGEYDDEVIYLDMHQLVNHTRWFVRAHARQSGVTDLHNAPKRMLAQVTAVLAAYYDMFGFYPTPARLDNAAHLSQRDRHCARYDSGAALSAALSASVQLAPAAAVTVAATFSGSVLPPTLTVVATGSVAFLLRSATQVAAAAAVRYADQMLTVATLSLARHARLTLHDARLVLTAGALQHLTATLFQLAAGAEAVLHSTHIAAIPQNTPLAPSGALLGWLGEHALPLRRAGNDGHTFVLQGETRAMFAQATTLTTATQSIALYSGDVLTLAAGERLRLEQDYHQVQAMAMQVFYADGATAAFTAVRPSEKGFNQRQLMAWLLTDAVRGTTTLAAPLVLFPWRAKIGSHSADSRDNVHEYPPCLDTRNFFSRAFQEKVKDHPITYAVAAECHYGGDPATCGRSGGLVVSVAVGAVVALPQPFTLTHSYTATLGNFLTLTLLNGVPQGGAVTLPYAMTFPVLEAGGATLAGFKISAGYVLAGGVPVAFSAGTPLVGGSRTRIENVPALLIYSPAPLSRVRCANPPVPVLRELFNQQTHADDITNLCYWLDDSENADGDTFFVIYAPPPLKLATQRNDYFILMGGRVRV